MWSGVLSGTQMCMYTCHELRCVSTNVTNSDWESHTVTNSDVKSGSVRDSHVYVSRIRTQMCIYRCHALRCVCEHVINSTGIAVAMHPPPKYHEPNVNATNSGVYQYMSRTQMYINTCHELRCVCMHELKRHRSISRRSISICVYVSRIYICIYKCDKLRRVCIHLTNSTGIAVSADPTFKIIDAAYPYVARRLLTGNDHPHTKNVNVFHKNKSRNIRAFMFLDLNTQRICMLHTVCALFNVTNRPKMSMYSKKKKHKNIHGYIFLDPNTQRICMLHAVSSQVFLTNTP